MDALVDQTHAQHPATAARWLGFGVASLPVLDLADRAGLFVLLASPSSLELGGLLLPLLQIAFFVAVGVGASMVLRRHRPPARPWFFAGCVLPVIVYVLSTGLRLAAVASLVALCLAFVQLRLARSTEPSR